MINLYFDDNYDYNINKKMPTVKYTDFDLSKLTFTTPTENERIPDITKYQLMSIPSYSDGEKNEMPTIQGPWMTLDYYGIPSKTEKSGKVRVNQAGVPLSDSERGKLKIPFNMENAQSKALYDLLVSIDKKVESEKEQIFGDKKRASVYKYQPIVRQAAEDPDAPEDAPAKPDYFVLKFDFDNKTGHVKSKVFVNNNGEREEMNVATLDEVQKYVRYKCEYRPIFTLCKLFASKAAKDGKRTYGVGLKLKMVEVKPVVSTREETETFFIDTDDEGEERKELVTATTKKVEETRDVSEDEEVPAKKTTTRGRKGKSTAV